MHNNLYWYKVPWKYVLLILLSPNNEKLSKVILKQTQFT